MWRGAGWIDLLASSMFELSRNGGQHSRLDEYYNNDLVDLLPVSYGLKVINKSVEKKEKPANLCPNNLCYFIEPVSEYLSGPSL